MPALGFPNPLVDQAGQPVTDVGTWLRQRVPELWQLFQDHVYRPGGHAVYLQDWRAWLDYADHWLPPEP